MSERISTGGVKKGRNEGEKVVTANRLLDGVVVYRARSGRWTEDLQAALVVEASLAMEKLAEAAAEEALVVGPYLMDVAAVDDGIDPDGRGRLRETIRYFGPTIHPEFERRPTFQREAA